MLSEMQVHLLTWIGVGALLERTDTAGSGHTLESFMGGQAVQPADLDALEAQGLIEALGTWTIQQYGYVRYGLTPFGVTVLHTHGQDGTPGSGSSGGSGNSGPL